MRAILQRVTSAEVRVDGRSVGKIGTGFVVLLGIGRDDNEADAEFIVDRVLGLRVFADAAGKMNRALGAVGGELLVISQFTLYADTSQRRPSFLRAASPADAQRLYEHVISIARARDVRVEEREFGAHMELSIINDGPVTIILDSRNR